MLMKDIMTADVPALGSADTLRKAIELFRQTRLDGIPAIDSSGCLIGLLTRANLFDALLAGSSLEEGIDEFLTRRVVTVELDVPYRKIVETVKSSPVGMGVVLDRSGVVRGVFTKVDMIMALFRESDLLNARLRAIYQAMHNGLISVDDAGKVTMLNPATESLLGVVEKEVSGLCSGQVFPGLDLHRILETGCVEAGRKWEFKGRKLLVNCTPVLDMGNRAGALAIIQDLTELEQVVVELQSVRTLQHTLQTVLDIAYDGIVVVDGEGKITLINQSMADFMGLEPEMVIGRHITGVVESSRLHIVARTGIPETGQLQQFGGMHYVVSRLPIVEQGRVAGAVGKIMFRNPEEIKELARRLETLENRLQYYREELKRNATNNFYTFESIVSVSRVMKNLKRETIQAARGLSTILLQGESGTGKELFAQAIHMSSPRRNGPFIKVNCAAVPDQLLESEFFGYAPGAFTGARKEGKPGRFELADGGTIFLDEIGDMSLGLQAKLLRVLQDREFDRVGGISPVRVNVRVVAATNRNLEEMVAAGKFRADLYYRLNVITLHIPPLRERPEDILPLAHCFLLKCNSFLGTGLTGIDAAATAVLKSYHWPGNVRELENVVERAVNFATGEIIKVNDLPMYLRRVRNTGGELSRVKNSFRSRMSETEWEIIKAALAEAGGNKTKAARMLGISRSRLYEKMKKAGL